MGHSQTMLTARLIWGWGTRIVNVARGWYMIFYLVQHCMANNKISTILTNHHETCPIFLPHR